MGEYGGYDYQQIVIFLLFPSQPGDLLTITSILLFGFRQNL